MFSLCIFVLSLAGRLRQSVGSFFWWPKTKDCAAHSMEPPVLLLVLQENQETWPRASGDLAAARTSSHQQLAVFCSQKSSQLLMRRGARGSKITRSPRPSLLIHRETRFDDAVDHRFRF